MLHLLALWGFLSSLSHLTIWGQWREVALGLPRSGEESRSAVGLWWEFLWGR